MTNGYSNYCIEVDEFKFHKIIKHVIETSPKSDEPSLNEDQH